MPILDIQQRFRELGRLRLGVLEKPERGKPRPRKIGTFRFTSRWRPLIDAAADLYGGEVRQAENIEDTWEVLTERKVIDVVIPPGSVLDQWYELWSGGGCLRRCDGVNLRDPRPGKCLCPSDPKERAALAAKIKPEACKPTTRLGVFLPELADLGIWRLETHGYYAAVELGTAAALIEMATRQGIMVPARLGLEERKIKRPDQPVQRFVVPVLQFRGTLGDSFAALGFGDTFEALALSAPEGRQYQGRRRAEELPGPVPALPSGSTPFGAEEPDPDEPITERQGPARPAAPPAARVDDAKPMDATEPELGDTPPAPDAFDPPPTDDERRADVGATYTQGQFLAMRARDVGLTDEHRHGLNLAITAGRTQSGDDLTGFERATVMAAYVQLARNQAVLEFDGVAWSFTDAGGKRYTSTGPPEDPSPARPAAGPPPAHPVEDTDDEVDAGELIPDDADGWRTFMRERRITLATVLRAAHQLAGQRGEEPPTTIDALLSNAELARDVYVAVMESTP